MSPRPYLFVIAICVSIVGIGGLLSAPAADRPLDLVYVPDVATPPALPAQQPEQATDQLVSLNRPSAAGGCVGGQCGIAAPSHQKTAPVDQAAGDGERVGKPVRRIVAAPVRVAARLQPVRRIGRLLLRRR